MTIQELVGDYKISGTNQNDSASSYQGMLSLTVNEAHQIIASWTIGHDQEQVGVGFFKNNILVINFTYLGDDANTYSGTVVYRCLTKNMLDGFWSEAYGDPKFIGTEQCFRITREAIN